MLPEAAEWMPQAEDALDAARVMCSSRKHLFAVLLCQLALGEGLKALVVQRTGELAPRTHNLMYLGELGFAGLSDEQREFVATLDAAGAGTRYPKDLKAAEKQYPADLVQGYIRRTAEVLECLKKDLKSGGS